MSRINLIPTMMDLTTVTKLSIKIPEELIDLFEAITTQALLWQLKLGKTDK